MGSSGNLRILLVDDHVLFRKALAVLLSAQDGLEIVGDAENGPDALVVARRTSPDLVLMDMQMPGGGGIAAVRALKQEMPAVKVVMLSAYDDDADLIGAVKAGADGYLLKSLPPAQLFVLLDGIRRGEAPVSGVVADKILKELRRAEEELDQPREIRETLTPRETDTLELLVHGKSNREIAEALCVSENTVKRHLVDIMEKLHLQNRIQLAVYAAHRGLDHIPADSGS